MKPTKSAVSAPKSVDDTPLVDLTKRNLRSDTSKTSSHEEDTEPVDYEVEDASPTETTLNLSVEETHALMSFLRNGSTEALLPITQPPILNTVPAISCTSMFIHGEKSSKPLAVNKNEDTAYTISVPFGVVKANADLPRLLSLDEIPRWQQGVYQGLMKIYTLASLQTGPENPLRGLNKEECLLYLLKLCDPHLLLMDKARRQLENEEFDGYDLNDVPNNDIFDALQRRGLGNKKKISKIGMLRLLCKSAMIEPTYASATLGHTASSNFTKFYDKISSLLVDNQYKDFDKSTIVTNAIMSGINPIPLRKLGITYLYNQIQAKSVVYLYTPEGRVPHTITLEHTRAVFRCIQEMMCRDIDPAMLTSTNFLQNLIVEPFGPPHIPIEYAQMMELPLPKEATPPPRNGAKPRWEDRRRPKEVDTNKPKGDDRKREREGDKTDRNEETPPKKTKREGGKVNRADGKALPAAKDPATVQCILCDEMGHKGLQCPKHSKCTCGTKTKNPRHDPFRCAKGPLTEAGKLVKATTKWQRGE